MPRSCAGPGQALLSQLQMPRSLSSSQQAQPDSRQHPPDGRGLNSSLSSMPFFDPVILSATSSSSLDRGGRTSFTCSQPHLLAPQQAHASCQLRLHCIKLSPASLMLQQYLQRTA